MLTVMFPFPLDGSHWHISAITTGTQICLRKLSADDICFPRIPHASNQKRSFFTVMSSTLKLLGVVAHAHFANNEVIHIWKLQKIWGF